jgi:hypothetical protein
MIQNNVTIEDGIYFLFPEGSSWIVAEFHNGKLVRESDESQVDLHNAAGDAWANIVPNEDTDKLVEEPMSFAIVKAVCGEKAIAEYVSVYKKFD